MREKILASDHLALRELCDQLAARAAELDRTGIWPAEQLRLCGEYGVFEWFLDPMWGGQGWDEEQVVRGYLALSAACLTATFIITQRTGACRRIAGSENEPLKQQWLPGLASGELFGTVGISHLTTSRRHLAKPVLAAEATSDGFRLTGYSPWVTGARAADVFVLAATLVERGAATDRQLLVAVPGDAPGITVSDPLPLVGLAASSTGPVNLDRVEVSNDWLLAGPVENVMASGLGTTTGGHETSTLAIGLSGAALHFLADEAAKRDDLRTPFEALRGEYDLLKDDLIALARGTARKCEPPVSGGVSASRSADGSAGASPAQQLRQRANSLALRASQAALAAAKGSGYVVGHPAGRWCREALFFLVWSCPQPVAAANLCELAGIAE